MFPSSEHATPMPLSSKLASLRPALGLASNPVTLLGAVLTTGAGITMVGFWALEMAQLRSVHPYAGIILFMALPGVFALGLLLMPLGIALRRRKLRAQGVALEAYPKLDFHDRGLRRAVVLFAIGTVLNVAILSIASYKGVEHMDSVEFCGQACHTVMEPEYTTFLGSPHARVGCAGCHIGEGAGWFVRSKLSGTRQVFAVAFGTYSRPIPSPVKHLRPARDTCEGCHWPQKFEGDKFVVRTRFEADEANTPLTTVLVLKVGGRGHDGAVGIHGRHLDDKQRISYVAIDGRREVIPKVTRLDDAGKAVEFVSSEVPATPEQLAQGEQRVMDCVDCHNRPTHVFELPERALDRALAEGRVSRELPFVKKKAVELLRAEYADKPSAARQIADGLTGYYKSDFPQVFANHRARVEAAAAEVQAIYARNIFPEMNVGWGVHPNHIGHEDFLGCFRCHDDNHKSADGRVISQDCETCHTILAQEETDPKILSELGLK
jgi:hypothetical protein